MPRILFGVSPIGLGHASRALVLLAELGRRGVDVMLFSGGEAAEFLAGEGIPVENIVDDPGLKVSDGEMRQASLWYIRSWLAQRRNVRKARQLIGSYRPDLVVCDEEFSGVTAAEGAGKKRVFISDELMLGFAHTWVSRVIEGRVERWYDNLQKSVDLLLIPDFGSDSGNRRYVGPIVRAPTMTCDAARAKYGLPQGTMVLFSMSGSGIGRELGERLILAMGEAGLESSSLVVTGNRGPKFTGRGVFDLGLIRDNQNLVASADLVVSTAGKSTIDEAAAAGTPLIAIPIRHHVEQERNARELGYSYEDRFRLPALIRAKIGRRERPRTFNGQVTAADAIVSLVRADR